MYSDASPYKVNEYSLTGLDSTKRVNLLLIKQKQSS